MSETFDLLASRYQNFTCRLPTVTNMLLSSAKATSVTYHIHTSTATSLHIKCVRCPYIWGGWWRWALVSPDGVAPSRMVGVSASVNLP